MTSANLNPQANPSHSPQTDERLSRYIGVSLALHFAFFVLLAVRAYVMPSEPMPLERAIRVDIVALPDKQVAQLPAPRPAEESVKAEGKTSPEPLKPTQPVAAAPPKLPQKTAARPAAKQDPTKINLNKTKKNQEAALKRLQAIEKLRNMQASDKPARQQTASTVVKGNEISQGNSLTGLTKIEHENYTESVHDEIKRHWNLPQWMANANMSATVRIFIDANGGLIKKEMIRSSKNPVFDQSVMAAIDASVPLPRPPSHLENLIAVRGIEIEFTPSGN